MANTFHGGGAQSPTSLSKPIEKVFEDAQHTGEILLNCRKLREYPKMAAKYDLVDTISADISRNRLNEVPKEICAYLSMEKIQCYHNVIKSIPEAIVQLQALTYLNLSRNQLSIIPSFISQLQTLEVLIASHNRLVSLPEEIGVLDRLMELDVSCNEISHLPVQIGDLKSLKSLNVRRNLLEILPVEISKLNLRKMDISGNRISKIPTVFRRIETLEDIVLHDNPLTMPPAHVCTKGKQHIMKHLEIVANREDKQRGILNEAEMKRFRKSLPPQQSVSSEEFRNLMDSPDKWKRHTVLSSDSGYSTTDSIDKISWSPQETNSEAPHLVNGSPLAVSTAHGRLVTDPRTLQERDSKREPPPPPQRVNSRLSPEKYTSSQDKYAPPSTLQGQAAQNRGPPTPPTLFPNSPQTPLTPPTPQGPGPGLGTFPGQSPGPILGTSLEDEFTRELQRQKMEYENKKKLAEQLRIQQEEEEEREQRRRAAQRIQDEQRAMLERQREDTRLMEEKRAWEEARQREVEEAKRQEELRLAEEARRAEEMQKAEEARRQEEERAQLEAKQQRVQDNNNYYLNNHHHNYRHAPSSPAWPPPPSPSLLRHQENYDQRTQNQQPQRLQSPASPGHYGQSAIPSPGHQYPGQGPSPTTDHFRAQNPNSPSYNLSRPSNFGQSDQSGHSDSHGYGHYGDPRSYDTSPRDHHPQDLSPRGQYSNELQSRLNPYGQSDDQSPADRRSDQDSPDYVRADHQHGSPFGQTNSMGLDPYSGYRKPALSASNSFKEERRPGPGTQYRRTTSDSNQRLPANVQQPGSQLQSNTVITNGPILEQPSMNGSGPTPRNTASPNPPSLQHVPGTTRSESTSNGQAGDRPSTAQGTVSRKPKLTAPVTTSRVAKPTDRHGRAAATTTTSTRTGVPTARKSNMNQDEELRKSTQSLKSNSDATTKTRGEQRLRTIQKEAVNNYMNRRSSGSTSSEDDRKRSTPTRTGLPTSTAAASKRAGTVMTNAHVKMLDDYSKESNPGFRRHHDTSEQMDILRKTISTRLKRTLPDSLSEALSDGVLLCHLANQIRPRSVASVHVPSPAVPKLTPAKCRRNVENFLEACRKIGVTKDQICGASDILEEKGLNRVAMTVAALVAIATNPKHQPATNV